MSCDVLSVKKLSYDESAVNMLSGDDSVVEVRNIKENRPRRRHESIQKNIL